MVTRYRLKLGNVERARIAKRQHAASGCPAAGRRHDGSRCRTGWAAFSCRRRCGSAAGEVLPHRGRPASDYGKTGACRGRCRGRPAASFQRGALGEEQGRPGKPDLLVVDLGVAGGDRRAGADRSLRRSRDWLARRGPCDGVRPAAGGGRILREHLRANRQRRDHAGNRSAAARCGRFKILADPAGQWNTTRASSTSTSAATSTGPRRSIGSPIR